MKPLAVAEELDGDGEFPVLPVLGAPEPGSAEAAPAPEAIAGVPVLWVPPEDPANAVAEDSRLPPGFVECTSVFAVVGSAFDEDAPSAGTPVGCKLLELLEE